MIKIKGKYNTAVCYVTTLEEQAAAQIQKVCDQGDFRDCTIRIMPDVHAGKGCTIGTTMSITDKVVPAMVGVDIGCGMETVKLAEQEMDLARLDNIVHDFVPCGFEVRKTPHSRSQEIDLTTIRCADKASLRLNRAQHSIGTLGGGNHFIEVNRSDNGDLYVVIHSGSRHLGREVAEYYQEEGYKSLCGNNDLQINQIIKDLKAQGRFQEIQSTIKALKAQSRSDIPKDLAYVEGSLFDDYIHDMKIVQYFAVLNRKAIADVILGQMGLTETERFTTIHNYIDTEEMILRKGAVSAKSGEKLLIPINMRDGSLICVGKGNPDWNYSAPHGAGRLMSRSAAFRRLSLDEYKSEMDGIFSTCVMQDTLDESPMAYKSMDEIIAQITPTADIMEHIRPIYNFKATK